MLKASEDMSVTWPNISEDIRKYLGDCSCAMSKNTRRLNTDTYWCLEANKEKAETITTLLEVWSESLGLELHELTFLTVREGEFEVLM